MAEKNFIISYKYNKCYSYNFNHEIFFEFLINQFDFMSSTQPYYLIQKTLFPFIKLDKGYIIENKYIPFYKILTAEKIEENTSFKKKLNRIFYIKNFKNQSLYFQILYTLYDNTCENKMVILFETDLLIKKYEEKKTIKLYHDYIKNVKSPFYKFLENFYKVNMNKISYIYESILIYCSQQKIYNYINNIENIMKLYYFNYKWIRLNKNTIEVINHETKINTIYSIYKIKKINNECINIEIKKKLIKNNEINSSYITHFKINPLSNNICWFCCDYPIPFGSSKSAIKNMTSVCKFIIKKIKQNLENNL
jgi:hypothetical protein